jgi:hypothetical protein
MHALEEKSLNPLHDEAAELAEGVERVWRFGSSVG